jgi:serine/threonine-protein kinase
VLCPSCHTDIPAGQRFCGACGAKIDAAEDVTVTSDPATRLAGTPASARTEPAGSGSSGWLSSSGSIDHGRFEPGTVLDTRYRIIGLLGRGGMGEVYRADDLRLGQPVALKFLPQSLAGDARRLAQLHNEVRTARQVSHANVCRVYDVGDVEGQLFLSMEYVDGEDLAASLRRIGRFPEDKALEIARQICAGLAAAHDRGVIHRDLKPANIMIDAAGRVRIMDFGLAAAGAVDEVRVGTPAYMAPEQLEGREVTFKSDIYALGLVLYELFTGRRAFTATTLPDLVQQQATSDITAPTELVKSLDPAIERAILRCLQRDPTERPSTVMAVSLSLPGGDPLAAALAAGETPSPAMVAAAGGESATVKPRAGMFWIASAAVLALVVTGVSDRVSLLARMPVTKPAAVLADRAEELRQALGYTDPVIDQATGFFVDVEYLVWASNHGSAEARWPQLAEGRPAPLRFWYRTSPRLLSPMNSAASRSLGDPPFGSASGMTIVEIDTKGRLLSFEAMPRQIDPAAQLPAPTVDWLAILGMAGLDPAAFKEVSPGRTPRMFADARHAWRGPLPDTELQVTVETASYRGRPVYFDIIGPWTSAPRDPGVEVVEDRPGPISIILVLVLLVVAALLTRANLKSGRADRRGAFRLAAFMVGLGMSAWLLQPHVRALSDERGRLFASVGVSLFLGGAMYVMYLAVEPYLRRSWPTSLMSWTRLLSGQVRDAFVGRALLVGIACGLAMTLLDRFDKFGPVLAGWPEPIPYVPLLGALLGLRPFIAAVLNSANAGVQSGLLTVLAVAMLRFFVQRVAVRFKLQRLPLDAMTSAIAIAVVTIFVAIDYTGDMRHMWVPMLTAELGLIVILYLVTRVGVLAAVFAYFVNTLTNRIPLTLDGSRFYAGQGWIVLLALLVLAAIGLKWARAGEPMFGTRPGPAYNRDVQ